MSDLSDLLANLPPGQPEVRDQYKTRCLYIQTQDEMWQLIRSIVGDVPVDGMIGGKKCTRPIPRLAVSQPLKMPEAHDIYPWLYAIAISSVALIKKFPWVKDGEFPGGLYTFIIRYSALDYEVWEHLRP